MPVRNKLILSAFVYFFLSALLTSLFISQKTWLYSSLNAMIISGMIAAVKWLIQVVAALVFLRDRKWAFIRRIGATCLIGSAMLFSYNLMYFLKLPLSGLSQFYLAIVLSVSVMIMRYYRSVKETGLPLLWFWVWIVCLAISVILQIILFF